MPSPHFLWVMQEAEWAALPGQEVPSVLPGAWLRYAPAFLDAASADGLLDALLAEIRWEQHHVRLFGRTVPSPRLSCWIGDAGSAYTYSGVRQEPRPWPCSLLPLRDRLRTACGTAFNSALANLYRDGGDAMGWHSDDEPELGAEPLIASLSLGGTRRFLLRPRSGGGRLCLALAHGSLLLMGGDCQQLYRHALPRTRRDVAPRINLTFRRIVRLG